MAFKDIFKSFNFSKKSELPRINTVVRSSNAKPYITWESFGLKQTLQETDYDIQTFIQEAYFRNAHVYGIINKIATCGASLDYDIVSTNKIGKDIPQEYKKLIKTPSPKITFDAFINECIIQYLITGSIFILKETAYGYNTPSRLMLLPTEYVNILKNSDEFDAEIVGYEFTYNKKVVTYKPEEIITVFFSDPTKISDKGISLLYSAWNTILASNSIQTAEKSIMDNKGAMGMVVSLSDYGLTPTERKNLDDNLKNRIGGADNFNKIITVSEDVKYIDMGKTPKDLDLTAMELNTLRRICNVFGVPSQLFNDPSNKTYSNMADAYKSLYTDTVIPICEKIIDALNFDLFSNSEYKIDIDYSYLEVLQKDKKEEAIKNGLNIDNILKIVNLKNLGYSTNFIKEMLQATLKDLDENEIEKLLKNL